MSWYVWLAAGNCCSACCDVRPFLSFCAPSAKTQLAAAECRWTSNVSGPHLSPLLSKDRRSYTFQQCDTKHARTRTHTHIILASIRYSRICLLWKRQLENCDQENVGWFNFWLSSAAIGWYQQFPSLSKFVFIFSSKCDKLLKKNP